MSLAATVLRQYIGGVKTYARPDGTTVEYDPDDACRHCGLPVVHASILGPEICPWCHTGVCRFCNKRFGTDDSISTHLFAKHREEVYAAVRED